MPKRHPLQQQRFDRINRAFTAKYEAATTAAEREQVMAEYVAALEQEQARCYRAARLNGAAT